MSQIQHTALITGSASGIGAALARRLARPGAALVIHARQNTKGCERVAEAAHEAGAQTAVVIGDLAEAETAAQLVDTALAQFGRLDAVVANAGFPSFTPFADSSRDDLEYAFAANLFSFYELARAARDALMQAPVGRLVAVGSFTAHVFRTDMPDFPLSAASKGGLETMVRSLALTFAREQVTVNCVVPGYIRKDAGTRDGLDESELAKLASRIPLGRIGEPEEVAAAIDFLLSAEACYITGQTLHVNGGLH